ncbi:MAG: hypothetical protein MI785_22210 [Kiloniellales bacterium]|nr:hypothetical protein [Kiloniellales bacterium]
MTGDKDRIQVPIPPRPETIRGGLRLWSWRRAMIWGAVYGIIAQTLQLVLMPGRPDLSPDLLSYYMAGEWIGSAAGGAALFLVVALIRNGFVMRAKAGEKGWGLSKWKRRQLERIIMALGFAFGWLAGVIVMIRKSAISTPAYRSRICCEPRGRAFHRMIE